MIVATEAESGDATEEHLHPAGDGHDLADHTVACDHMATYAGMYAFCEVQFEVDAQYDLEDEHEHERGSEGSMDVGCELPAAVSMAEEVAYNGNNGAKYLDGDMPS